MLTDLQDINKMVQPMGVLQLGIPLPSKSWPLIIIDSKDYFFTVPLHEHDRERLFSQYQLIIAV